MKLVIFSFVTNKIANKEIDVSHPLYADLVANFFISNKPIPDFLDILATRYRTKKSFLEDFTSLHIFVLTLRCNQKCKYCQVSRQKDTQIGYDMSIDDINKSIDLMFMSPSKYLTVEFQGGEPLLVFENVKYAVKRINDLNKIFNKEITFVLCTNLLDISNEILDFCLNYEILISTSLDGPDFIHNNNRRTINNQGTYDIISANIQKSRTLFGNDKVSALMTATETSLHYPIEIVDEYINQGFTSIFLRAINPFGHSKKERKTEISHINKFIEFYKKALLYIIELNIEGIFFIEEYANLILSKMFTPFSFGFTDLQSPHGVINSVIVFNYDGYVYASDESRMLAEEGEYFFQLGHIHKNPYKDIFYGKKAKQISRHWSNESLPGCSECAFQIYCGADPVRNYVTQGNMTGFRPTNAFCKKNKEIIRFLFDLISENTIIEKVFWSWINGIPFSKDKNSIFEP